MWYSFGLFPVGWARLLLAGNKAISETVTIRDLVSGANGRLLCSSTHMYAWSLEILFWLILAVISKLFERHHYEYASSIYMVLFMNVSYYRRVLNFLKIKFNDYLILWDPVVSFESRW